MPLELELALECRPVVATVPIAEDDARDWWTFERYPTAGSYLEQLWEDLEGMRVALQAFQVFSRKEWTLGDADFIAWVERG